MNGLSEIVNCDPDDRTAPECIHDSLPFVEGQVLILPGITGATPLCDDNLALETGVDDLIDGFCVPLWTAQVWDWTASGGTFSGSLRRHIHTTI